MHTGAWNMRVETRILAILATLGVFSAMSCLLLTDRNKDQCVTAADCAAKKSAAFMETQCVQGMCVSPDGGSTVAGCTTTAECLANTNTPNTYCSADKQCLPMISPDCTSIVTVDGKPIASDAIILGAMGEMSGNNAPAGLARVRALQLAYTEFSQYAVGIPSGPGTKSRPLALVICDENVDPVRAAKHLITDLRVPAIIGPAKSGTTNKVAKEVAIPGGTVLISPTATSPDLATLADNGLVWRTSSSFQPEAKAFADLFDQLIQAPDVRSALGLVDSAALVRVAVLARGDSYGKGLAEELAKTLRFNNRDVASNIPDYFFRKDFPDLNANPDAETATIVSQCVSFKPHFMMGFGSAELTSKGLVPIEEQWITGPAGSPRPFLVFSEGAKGPEIIAAVSASESAHPDRKLRERLRVFGPRYNADLYKFLASRYQGVYGEEMPDIYGVTGSYDAFYLIAYALIANQTLPLTGGAVAEGLKRMVPPGMSVSAGPSDVGKATSELTAGRNIDYSGVTGALDFDITTGDSPGDYNIYCVQPTGFWLTGQYFDSTASKLVGAYVPCP
jgi:ABC-type branched-subunit amino acid transport system substrate-binding protein